MVHTLLGSRGRNTRALVMEPRNALSNAGTDDSAAVRPDSLRFLNRDHIVLASVQDRDITLMTTLGTTVVISGSPKTLEAFMDQLLNAYGSNFVAVPTSPAAEEMVQ